MPSQKFKQTEKILKRYFEWREEVRILEGGQGVDYSKTKSANTEIYREPEHNALRKIDNNDFEDIEKAIKVLEGEGAKLLLLKYCKQLDDNEIWVRMKISRRKFYYLRKRVINQIMAKLEELH